ncbi:MAG: alpha-galactosidase [Clostridiaceae bacterium]
MSIVFNQAQDIFHLTTKNTSYVMKVLEKKYLSHLYWGKKIRSSNLNYILQFRDRCSFNANPDGFGSDFSLNIVPQEYPCYGTSDYRTPAYEVQLENGTTVVEAYYKGYKIIDGKPKLQGLPATYGNEDQVKTLEIELYDELLGLKIILSYSVFYEQDVITRSVKFVNGGNEEIKLLRGLSSSVDFHSDNYDILQLSGAWARERNIIKRPVAKGIQSIESRRGFSSHVQNPFIALLDKKATETNGDVYGFSLVYSGNFLAQIEADENDVARVQMGINPFDFNYLLKKSEFFQTPEVVMVYSDKGLNKMSNIYHRIYRENLMRGKYKEKERPILINNWEATYFDFNEEKIENIVKQASSLGIELFVLDDGWFGKRNDDKSSLGDWFVNKNKIPSGIKGLSSKIIKSGIEFGLWFEPEMISEDSELFRKHPDWIIHCENRSSSLGRNQYVLDLSRDDVCEEIINMISKILEEAPISYVKWDANRNMTEIGSSKLETNRQRETAHRYVLGLYKILENITSRFPDILFESCSGGGGRFDPGMLYYMPQTWTSDDTDSVERLKIQYGTSLVYPIISMGAHLSAVPNHQVERITPLDTRANVAMAGNFGYEIDVTRLEKEEKDKIKNQVEFYKEIRNTIQFGDFYRLLSPFEGNETAWMFISKDKNEVIVFYYYVLAHPNPTDKRLKLIELQELSNYALAETDEIYGGDELMNIGINIPYCLGDFKSYIFRFNKI